MKIKEIIPGKTYCKTNVDRNVPVNSPHREVEIKIYVLDIDTINCRVLASIGGAPSKWYNKSIWGNWKMKTVENKAA